MLTSRLDESNKPERNEKLWNDFCADSFGKAQTILSENNLTEAATLVKLMLNAEIMGYEEDPETEMHTFKVSAEDRKFDVHLVVMEPAILNSNLDIEIWEIDPLTGEYETTMEYMDLKLEFKENLDVSKLYVMYKGNVDYTHEYNK